MTTDRKSEETPALRCRGLVKQYREVTAVAGIDLEVLAEVPKASQSDFIDATLRAKTGCLTSRVLRATISMNAKLGSSALAVSRPRPPNHSRNRQTRS